MWSEIAPDRCHNIAVEGYNVVAYQFGDGDETVLCLNGGATICAKPTPA